MNTKEFMSRPFIKLMIEMEQVQDKLANNKPDDSTSDMMMRFARFLGSPSKLNALSVIKSNPSYYLAAWLLKEEERLKD